MEYVINYFELDEALRRAGSTWGAAQAHGLLCGQLAVNGGSAQVEWITQILEGTDPANALRAECESLLVEIFEHSHSQFSGRQSEFHPLLPPDDSPATERVDGLAHWCEGFLHGLVSSPASTALKNRLSGEPISEVIKDLLQITRADVEEDADDESTESAYTELLEYVRVTAQVVYEELAVDRGPAAKKTRIH